MSQDTIRLIKHFSMPAEGIIHVGANVGQEFSAYKSMHASTVVYVEPISRLFGILKDTVEQEPGHHAVQALCSDSSGIPVDFNIASNGGQSSSMLALGHHSELYPEISYVGQETHVTTTLDDLIEGRFPGKKFDVLVVDTQGADLLVLKGAVRTLRQIQCVHVEVSEAPVYQDGCTWEEIKEFLGEQGFKLKNLDLWESVGEWGMAFFMKVDSGTRPIGEVLLDVRVDRFLIPKSVDLDKVALSGPVASDEIRAAVGQITGSAATFPLVHLGTADGRMLAVPDDLDGIGICLSAGVKTDKTLEDHLAADYGVKSFLCNYKSNIENLSTPLIPGMQVFEKKWLSTENSNECVDFNDWVMKQAAPESDLMLHMNVGGFEYRNFLYISEENIARFRIVLLEIHRLDLLRKPVFFHAVFKPVIEKILRSFSCVHAREKGVGTIDPIVNSVVSKTMRLAFVRKDRI